MQNLQTKVAALKKVEKLLSNSQLCPKHNGCRFSQIRGADVGIHIPHLIRNSHRPLTTAVGGVPGSRASHWWNCVSRESWEAGVVLYVLQMHQVAFFPPTP
jgi:hypothetical protein